MRLSRTSWLIVGIGIFVIAAVALYMVYSQLTRERSDLNTDLSAAQAALPKAAAEKVDWENQLARLKDQLTQGQGELANAKSSLEQSKAMFPVSVQSIEYDEELFNMAYGQNLEVVGITVDELSPRQENGVSFPVSTFTLSVKGKVADILKLVDTIVAGQHFLSASVEDVEMQVPEPLSETEKAQLTPEAIAEREMPSATIKLNIYSYRGE